MTHRVAPALRSVLRCTAVAAVAVAFLHSSVVGVAHAQSAASETAAARELYAQGVAAADAGRISEAIARFERSYALAPRDATLLNLAQLQERDGRVVAAIDSYRRFLARAEPEMIERHGDRAREAIATLTPRIARLEVVVFGADASDEILLDDAPLARASLGLDLPVDPGRHEVTVRRGESSCGSASTEVTPGGRGAIEVRAVCLAAAPTAVTGASPTSPPPSEDPAPFIGLGIGGAVVGVGVVILAVVLSTPAPAGPEPFMGNVGMGSYVVPLP